MKYPIGIQDFRELRQSGHIYVDKTELIYKIISGSKYFFLSRPRRFGKSLLLSTLKELYAGSRELFEGLWIENKWNWQETNPVIWLKFASQGVRTMGLEAALHNMLHSVAAELSIALDTEAHFDQKFKELIVKTAAERKVVLLIDEYDKPIIDFLDDIPGALENRNMLKSFYSVLKDCDPYLQTVFITGVSAFSKVSIFSDLNNLDNLTLSPSAYTLLGITQQELERFFPEQMAIADVEKMKRWYNGYSWGSAEKVYNPFSILRFFKDEQQYQNFWFETGTPTFLVKEMKKRQYFNVRRLRVSSAKISVFNFEQLDPITVLFQTGYLTILDYDPEDLLYTLDYPNLEVRKSFEQMLLEEYQEHPIDDPLAKVVNLRNALRTKDIEKVIEIINSAFASIPYELWQKENEHFYHAIIHLTFSLLGTYLQSEVHSAGGRCDAIVHTEDFIYALEFKLDKSADEALRQIHDKAYLAPYADSPKQKIAVGINFSSAEKRVTEWKHTGGSPKTNRL